MGGLYRLLSERGKEMEGAAVAAQELQPGEVHELKIDPERARGTSRLYFGGHDTRLKLKVKRRLPPAFWGAAAALLVATACGAWLGLSYLYRPSILSVDNTRAFNFGDSKVLVTATGGRLTRVILRNDQGKEVREFAVQPWTDRAGGYYFRPAGAPPGTYALILASGLFRGPAAEARLAVDSPAFSIEPTVWNRLAPLAIALTSKNNYPLEREKIQKLAFRPKPTRVEPAKIEPGKESNGKAAKPEPAAPRAGKPRRPVEFAMPYGRPMPLKAGTFQPAHEGEYEVLLDGLLLTGEFTASGQTLTVRVAGPQVLAVEPNPATRQPDGQVQIALKGLDLPAGLPLELLAGEKENLAALRLEPIAGGGGKYQGSAAPGKYRLAWPLPGAGGKTEPSKAPREEIDGLILEVYPAPQVLAVSPALVPPDTQVELTVNGLNLKNAPAISLKPLSGGEGELTFALDSSKVREVEGAQSEVQLEPLSLKSGKYAIGPGEKAVLEVIENCQKLLDAYRGDLSGLDRLTSCLAEKHARDDVRRAAAVVFFDQGLFDEALALYRRLDDLPSRFRAALIARFLKPDGKFSFAVRAGDPPGDPFYRAAVALGWVEGKQGEPPLDPSGTWDVDFARGFLAADPRVAIEALNLSIQKKSAAAVVKEIQPFAPALERLALAQLNLGGHLLKSGQPIATRDHIAQNFFATAEFYERLPKNDQARCAFYHGHALLWYSGDEDGAVKSFQQGQALEGEEYAALCQEYLEAIAPAPGGGAPAISSAGGGGSAWEGNFLTALKYYLQVRNTPNTNILTEKYDFGSRLYPEERKRSVELHAAIRQLETAAEVRDPFAQNALLFYLRNAQRLSWPAQEGGRKGREHRERLLSAEMGPGLAPLRDFYLLEGEIGPLESAQLTVLPVKEVSAHLKKVSELLSRPELPEAFKARLKGLQRKLQLS